MSYPSKSFKRPYDRNPAEQNWKGNWQKTGGFNSQNQPLKFSPGNTVFRILFPVSKSGRLIGKNGTIINNIREETGVKIKVEEPLAGDDERVVVIVEEVEVINEKSKEGGKDKNSPEKTDEVEENEGNKDKVSSPAVDSQSEKGLSPAQKALFLIFERTVDEEDKQEEEDDDEDTDGKKSASARLLVFSSQVGCVLGKGGKVIKQMAAESGAQIRIVPRDKLPQCVSTSDDLVQVTGELEAVRKALELLTQQLLNNPPRDVLLTTKATGPSNPFPYHSNHSKLEARQAPNFPSQSQVPPYPLPCDRPNYHLDGPHTIPNHRETLNPSRMEPPVEIGFRVLCHIEKVGGIIGKGGVIINMIHRETGCTIRILDGAPASQDRIVLVSGPVHPDDRVSPVQDAVLRVQGRIFAGGPQSNEKVARLLVSSNHIGCLVGKGGAILAEMRRLSGAYIEIISKDQFPELPYENDEVVQVTGGFESVQEALMQITARLRHNHLFGDTFPSSLSIRHHQAPPFPYMGRREPSPPPGPYGLSQRGHIHPFEERPPFGSWQHRTPQPVFQGVTDVGRPPADYPPPGRVLPPPSAIITNTTVEVVVPRDVVPSIYGEDGSSLKQIRKISGAKITIGEPKPGANETGIVISGTPEQAHAAQSLLQAFVLSGTDSP